MEQGQIKKRWTDNINTLYLDTDRIDRPVIKKQMTGNPITSEEIKNSMIQMKKNKAVGNDELAFEIIGALRIFGLEKITDVVSFVYKSENVPDE